MGKRVLGFALLCLVGRAGQAWAYNDAANPLAPATDQVQGRFAVIQQEISRLQGIGDTAGAAAMQASLQHFQDELAGTAPSSVAGPELDVVGLYTADFGNPSVTGTVNVQLQSSDRPVVLALGGYDPIKWNLQLDPGAQVQKIVLSNSNQVLLNPPPGVQVVTGPQNNYFGYQKDWEDFPPAARKLFGSTGLPISSFQGNYGLGQIGQQFQIGPGNSDWRAQRVLREMNDLYLQATAFKRSQAAILAAGFEFPGVASNFHTSSGALGRMTALGVTQVIADPPSGVTDVAYDPNGKHYYGLHGDKILDFDSVTGAMSDTLLTPEGDLSRGLAFDPTRNRLVVSDIDWLGTLSAYSLTTHTWSALASLDGRDLGALTYFPPGDCFYGLCNDPYAPTELIKYGSGGEFLGVVALSDMLPPGDPSALNVELAAAGNYLAVIIPPSADLTLPELTPQAHGFLIDPATGEVVYSGVFVPEPGVGCLILVAAGMLAGARRRCHRVQSSPSCSSATTSALHWN